MEVTAGNIPTYLPSTVWFQNKTEPVVPKTRNYTRTLIDSNKAEGMILTVPVVGGSSAVKRQKPSQLKISGHGDWTRIHLGAIEAAYGKEPYFQHLFPQIASIISNYPQQLAELNVLLMSSMLDFLNFEETADDLEKLRRSAPVRCSEIKERLAAKINPYHSFLEPLFRIGPDSIFLL